MPNDYADPRRARGNVSLTAVREDEHFEILLGKHPQLQQVRFGRPLAPCLRLGAAPPSLARPRGTSQKPLESRATSRKSRARAREVLHWDLWE